MASPVETLAKLPIWQRALVWLVVTALLVGAWYFVWYADAVAARKAAKLGLDNASAELVKMQDKLANFEEEQRKAAEMEAQIRQQMEVLPMSASTVDNLMQTFQQQARLVGLQVESWTPGAEEQLDFYAKLPVQVKATGTWLQIAEFFRRVSELRQIVSVQDLQLVARQRENISDVRPELDISFQAATYRFLTDAERQASQGKQGTRRRRAGEGS